MKKSKITADYLAARAKTAATVMQSTGWVEGQINAELLGVDSVFVYVLDHATEWIWCASVPRDSFFSLLELTLALPEDEIIGQCNWLIQECAKEESQNPDRDNELAITLMGYVGLTRSYKATERATKANHFVVIRYSATDTLRPFAVKGPDQHLVACDVIKAAMAQVVALDKTNHPNWVAA